MAKELADYFNCISSGFELLKDEEIPRTHQQGFKFLKAHAILSRIKHFHKPKSMVASDVFLSVLTKYCDLFAIPLCTI